MNTKQEADICIVVALSSKKRAIGNKGKLLWHIPGDLQRFKSLTLGHPVIMGRKTFESIVSYSGGPLPDRTNIIVSRSVTHIDGCLVFDSLEKALTAAKELDRDEIHIGGGSEIYTQALPFVDRLYITRVHDEPEADAFFPEYTEFKKVVSEEKRDHDGLLYEWVTLERE